MCALGALPPVVNLPLSEKTTDQPDADVDQITFLASWRTMLAAGLLSAVVMLCAGTISAQTPVTTWHYDNARTSANMTETVLTPANVTPTSFGKLFSEPVDGIVSAQPLYLPGVVIPGQGTHNVVYVATQHDSVYAFDADHSSSSPLWMTSLLTYSPAGATSVPATVQKNGGTTGWSEVGIISTPVIDPVSGTIYLVAETYENAQVVHRLHALDVTTGLEKLGGPVTIAATYTLNGVVSTFQDLYQINRPGLLLANGHIYIAFGSNCCNAYSQGWVMSYNASTLRQEGTFNAEPGKTLASIWQRGAGISADSAGNIYAETGEGFYSPGTNLGISVLKLSQTGTTLSLADYFTPYNYQALANTDMDMAQSVTILPDQPGQVPHEAIVIGKEGTVYVLNRDNMGKLCAACTTTDSQIVQEIPKAVGFESGSPVYWNNMVYFTGTGVPALAFNMSNGSLVLPAAAQSVSMNGSGHALITANGTSNGILWFLSGNTLWALDPHTMVKLYNSVQAANGRDVLPGLAHFATPIVADGKLFVATQNSLVVYGLFSQISAAAGGGQSAAAGSALPVPLKVQVTDSYSQNALSGVPVTFTDNPKGGVFNPPTAVTDSTGAASTSYTLPTKAGAYTVTASSAGYRPASFSETSRPGAVTAVVVATGQNQTAALNSPLPLPLVAKARDAYGNGVPGIPISFSDGGVGGAFSATTVTSNATGFVSVTYRTSPTKAGTLKITASSGAVPPALFWEKVSPGPVAAITRLSGNAQSAAAGTTLAQPLVAKVTDQYGNAISGASVSFTDNGAGGTFSANPVLTGTTGAASVNYTTGASTGTKTIVATVSGVSTGASFTVTVK
jgi:hypothetical protein